MFDRWVGHAEHWVCRFILVGRYNTSMDESSTFSTPMMQQYLKIKESYADAILFFRLGDFYEMFLDDATVGAKVLGITLTSRAKGKDGKMSMCRMPYHAAENYIQKLVNHGYKVAICEQVAEPKPGKDIVEREVIRVVTPSTMLAEVSDGAEGSRDYLMTFVCQKNVLGTALISPKNGEVLAGQTQIVNGGDTSDFSKHIAEILADYIARYRPAEILLSPNWYENHTFLQQITRLDVSPFRHPEYSNLSEAVKMIKAQYGVQTLEAFGLDSSPTIQLALAQGLDYLVKTQKRDLGYLKNPSLISGDGYLSIGGQTIRNLELFNTVRRGEVAGSLYHVLNKTYTSMGSRLLKNWLMRPLAEKVQINARLDGVSQLVTKDNERREIEEILKSVSDIERSLGRLSLGIGNARDLVAIRFALGSLLEIAVKHSSILKSGIFHRYWEKVDVNDVEKLYELLNQAVVDLPPAIISDGGMVKDGYSVELDQLRAIARGGKDFLLDLERREQIASGIPSLKVAYNKVFGYYIEVSKANAQKVPIHYVRKQTLVNAERYIIPELKLHEEQVLDAESRRIELEQSLYRELVRKVLNQTRLVQAVAELIAVVDVIQGFAACAVAYRYVRPEICDEPVLEIGEGRHPVIDRLIGESFVPNGVSLHEEEKMMIITGANMAGKSTYIRQVALMVIMAQMGAYVPAKSMRLLPFTQIHSRIGAMDSLAAGLSTFMVEMVETASILNNVMKRSLVILDEIGRGTSTYDGLAIAWAVSEYLVGDTKAQVLFATHYHELTEMATVYPNVKNYHMAVAKVEKEIVFLYRVKEGAADQSFGIEVAKRAGLPKSVVKRAEAVLADLQVQARAITPISGKQLGLFAGEKD